MVVSAVTAIAGAIVGLVDGISGWRIGIYIERRPADAPDPALVDPEVWASVTRIADRLNRTAD